MGDLIPSDYWTREGRQLSLWRFEVKPSLGPELPRQMGDGKSLSAVRLKVLPLHYLLGAIPVGGNS